MGLPRSRNAEAQPSAAQASPCPRTPAGRRRRVLGFGLSSSLCSPDFTGVSEAWVREEGEVSG